jgi:hypothetical protein
MKDKFVSVFNSGLIVGAFFLLTLHNGKTLEVLQKENIIRNHSQLLLSMLFDKVLLS